MDEIIVSGYCRVMDGNRILCIECDGDEFETDCLYPKCEFAGNCKLMEAVFEKLKNMS